MIFVQGTKEVLMHKNVYALENEVHFAVVEYNNFFVKEKSCFMCTSVEISVWKGFKNTPL